jgi:hypothetical protein
MSHKSTIGLPSLANSNKKVTKKIPVTQKHSVISTMSKDGAVYETPRNRSVLEINNELDESMTVSNIDYTTPLN